MSNIKNNLKFNEVEKRLDDLNEAITENNDELNKKISENTLSTQENSQKINDLNLKITEIDSTAKSANETATSVEKSVTNLSTQVNNCTQQINNCNEQIQTCKTQINSTTATANQNKTNIGSLQSLARSIQQELNLTNTNVNNLENNLSNTNAQVDALQTSMTNANSKIAVIESNMSSTNTKINNIETNLTAADTKVENLEESLSRTNNNVSSLESSLSNTNSKLNNLIENEVATLQTQVSSNTNQISTNATSINGINRELTTISDTLDNYSVTLDKTLSLASENQTKLDTVDKYATSLNSKITENTSKINEVEQKASTQPDWNENDEQSVAFIKNKPNIETNNAKKEEGVFFVEGLSTSEAGDWQGTNSRISSYYDGLIINFKVGVSGSSAGTTLNINTLGAKPCYLRGTTKITTHYAVGTMLILCYNASTDAFYSSDYDANNYAYVRQYGNNTNNANYPLLFSNSASVPATYASNYASSQAGFTYNPSTKTMQAENISATKLTENGTSLTDKYASISSLNSTNTSLAETSSKLQTLEQNINNVSSNYVTTNTVQEITSDKTIKGRVFFKDFVDVYDSSISGYPTNYFRLQTYNGKFYLTYQNNIALDDPDAWSGTAFEITESTGVTNFKKTPTVNGVELATKTDVKANGNIVVDGELSSTSSNPVQNKVILERLTSMSQAHNLLKTDVDLLTLDINSNKTDISSLQNQMNNAGLSINENAININSLATAVDKRAKNDLSNVSYPTNTKGTTTSGAGDRVVNTYISSDGKTWARIWASGWKEMGGTLSSPSGWATLTLPTSFSNSTYTLIGNYTQSAEDATTVTIKFRNKSASSFKYALTWINSYSNGYSGTEDSADWYACGY